MYRVIPENERRYYTREEMKEKFDGKWLYLVNSEYTDRRRFIRAKVAVIADRRYEGREKGVYRKLDIEENDIVSRCDLLHDDDDDWDYGEDYEVLL